MEEHCEGKEGLFCSQYHHHYDNLGRFYCGGDHFVKIHKLSLYRKKSANIFGTYCLWVFWSECLCVVGNFSVDKNKIEEFSDLI